MKVKYLLHHQLIGGHWGGEKGSKSNTTLPPLSLPLGWNKVPGQNKYQNFFSLCSSHMKCMRVLNLSNNQSVIVCAKYLSHGYSTGTNLSISLRNTHYSFAAHNEKTLTLISIMYAAKLPVYYTVWTDTSCRNHVFYCFFTHIDTCIGIVFVFSTTFTVCMQKYI